MRASPTGPTMAQSAWRTVWFAMLGLSRSMLVVGIRLLGLVYEDHSAVPSLYTVSLCLAIGHGAGLLWTCVADIRAPWGENDAYVELMGGRVVMGILLLASIAIGLFLNFGGGTNIPFLVSDGLPQIILIVLSAEIASLSTVLYFPFARESVSALCSLTVGSAIGSACVILFFTALIHHPYDLSWNTYVGGLVEVFQLFSLVGWAYLLKRPRGVAISTARDCDETVDCGIDELDEAWYRGTNASEATASESENLSADEETPSDDARNDVMNTLGASGATVVAHDRTRFRFPTLDATFDKRTGSIHANQFWMQALAASSVVLLQHLHSFDYDDGDDDMSKWKDYFFSLYFETFAQGFGAALCSVSVGWFFNGQVYHRIPTLFLTLLWTFLLVLVLVRSNGIWFTAQATFRTLSVLTSILFGFTYGFTLTACYQAVASKCPAGPAGDHTMRVNATWNQLGALVGSLVAVLVVLR